MTPEMLQALAANPDAAREMLQAALAERAAEDPRLAMMMQMFAQQEPAPAPPAREPKVERVRARLRELRDELRELRQRNDVLAAALGACALCWGDDEDCGDCGGEGMPGWQEPDPTLFRELVTPAAERRAARRTDGKPSERSGT